MQTNTLSIAPLSLTPHTPTPPPPPPSLLLSSTAFGQEVTFNVLVEGETLSIKEKTLSVPRHDKGAIVLRFAPVDAPKEETIIVKLEESSTGIQHTVKVNATWS